MVCGPRSSVPFNDHRQQQHGTTPVEIPLVRKRLALRSRTVACYAEPTLTQVFHDDDYGPNGIRRGSLNPGDVALFVPRSAALNTCPFLCVCSHLCVPRETSQRHDRGGRDIEM